MNLPTFDQTRKDEKNTYGESVRLSNELRYRPLGTKMVTDPITTKLVSVIDEGRLWGFDVETAEYGKLLSYFTDKRIKKRSASLIAFVNRILSIRFTTDYNNDKLKIEKVIGRAEMELIQSETKNEIEWVGEVSYQNMVRLDGSLTNNRVRSVKLKDGSFKSVVR